MPGNACWGRLEGSKAGCSAADFSGGQHLLEERWQVQLLWLWLILQKTWLLQGTVAWVCQIVLLECI